MSIFIQEYACGGGMRKQVLTNTLLTEGFGILNVLIRACKQQGYTVMTTLDQRLNSLQDFLVADKIQFIQRQDDLITKSKQLINQCTYFLIIAPETDKIAIRLVNYYQKKTKSISLNSDARIIATLSNKKRVYERCSHQAIKVPKTFLVKKKTSHEITNSSNNGTNRLFFQRIDEQIFDYPILVKPKRGTACEGILKIDSQKNLLAYLENDNKEFLIQEFVVGEPLSATIAVAKNTIRILSINKQIINEEGRKLSYIGGISNINPPFAQEMKTISEEILRQFPGIKGPIGIDFLYQPKTKEKKESIYLLEINARPTTALCGLLNGKPQTTKRFIDILFGKEEDKNQGFDKISYFKKVKLAKNWTTAGNNLYEEMKQQTEIITPPLILEGRESELFIRGLGNSVGEAKKDFEQKKAHWLAKILV
jgi:hypothetical protein